MANLSPPDIVGILHEHFWGEKKKDARSANHQESKKRDLGRGLAQRNRSHVKSGLYGGERVKDCSGHTGSVLPNKITDSLRMKLMPGHSEKRI